MRKVNKCLMMVTENKHGKQVKFICEDIHHNCKFYTESKSNCLTMDDGTKVRLKGEDGEAFYCCESAGREDKDGNWPCMNNHARNSVLKVVNGRLS